MKASKLLCAFTCASTLRLAIAGCGLFNPLACVFGDDNAPKGPKYYFNLFCKYDGDNDLVCMLDALNYESKNADDFNGEKKYGANFCGSWTVQGDFLNYGKPPADVRCTSSLECISLNFNEVITTGYHHHIDQFGDDAKSASQLIRPYKIHFNADGSKKKTEIKLMPRMLSQTGFTAAQLGKNPSHEPGKQTEAKKKYYVGVSGGGFRALTSAMGAFRGLSNKNALSMVDMFSSVSGGTWFTTMLAFNEKFAEGVLTDKVPIADVAMEYLENEYFKVMNHISEIQDCKGAKCNDVIDQTLKALLARESMIPARVKASLSDYILMAEHFDFNWQAMLEDAVLGRDTSIKNLNSAPIATHTLAKLGPQSAFAFNWLQMHQYGEHEGKKWFLKARDQTKANKVAQYPVYTTAVYSLDGKAGEKTKVKSRGKPINDVFEPCYKDGNKDVCGKFDFSDLTVGQAASASSAAGGTAAVKVSMANIVSYARAYIQSIGSKACAMFATIAKTLLPSPGVCDQKVIDEGKKIVGCAMWGGETVHQTGGRWSSFMRDIAVTTTTRMTDGKTFKSVNAMDPGLTDNNGLGSILAEYLGGDQTNGGQVLVIMNNGLGDHQMESYFDPDTPESSYGGALCQPKLADPDTRRLFTEMQGRYEQGFKDIGATFNKIKNHPICAAPSPPIIFFKGAPPTQYRFEDLSVPRHITYAYKKDVEIKANQHFYNVEGNAKIDVLFLILNANVGLMPAPRKGSQAYTGTAYGMEKAVDQLHTMFPSFFPNKIGED